MPGKSHRGRDATASHRTGPTRTSRVPGKSHRGRDATALRGLDKVTGWASFFVLTYDILRLISLGR